VPPLSAGDVNVTDCVPTPVLVAVPIVGAPGTVQGVGQLLAVIFCAASVIDQMPEAVPVFPDVVVG
jgi:hypothetical protein